MLKLSASTLRHWERTLGIIRPHKNRRGDRLYTIHDIRKLQTVKRLLHDEGYTLAGVRRVMKQRSAVTQQELRQALLQLRALLEQMAALLDQLFPETKTSSGTSSLPTGDQNHHPPAE